MMNAEFSRTLSLLRQEKGVSQRSAAADLGISQPCSAIMRTASGSPGWSSW